MKDILGMLSELHRPRLLIRAARIAAQDYNRTAHLGRLLGGGAPARHGSALMKLIELETDIDDSRRRKEAGYSISRHVEVLSALMGEARLLRQSQAGI
ncbi:DUF6477 family protein [Pacificoceanicola onchidii]|uniref:DUF6477 family protein n=1 Tax=Pacificoceanicola onchidii TaxID=2562685 RepID=UPI0010A31B8D|nr:DUF6477 family protein [Pacificoceanicola onchidii]